MQYPTLADFALLNKRIMLREDFNVPLENGQITSDARIKAALPAIKKLITQGARIILLSHLGRPTEGEYNEAFSLAPVAKHLETLLGQPVPLIKDWLENPFEVEAGHVVLCENVRFLEGEKSCDEALSKKIANLCDIYVMDAFATAHRKHASTYGALLHAKTACIGDLLDNEVRTLSAALNSPKRPLISIVGGSKVSTKLDFLSSLADISDTIITGGGITNTLLASQGVEVGNSLIEPDFIEKAKNLLQSTGGKRIVLPTDVVTATGISEDATATNHALSGIPSSEMILDSGKATAEHYATLIRQAGTVIWNGPVGVFECEPFSHATKTIARAVAETEAFTIIGGGDTIAAVEKYGVTDQINLISTGGGAFLAFVEDGTLPIIEFLTNK